MIDLEKLKKDFEGSVLDSIGTGEDDKLHFIFKIKNKYFGFKLKQEDMEMMEYKVKPKKTATINDKVSFKGDSK